MWRSASVADDTQSTTTSASSASRSIDWVWTALVSSSSARSTRIPMATPILRLSREWAAIPTEGQGPSGRRATLRPVSDDWLRVLGWDDHFAAAFAPHADRCVPGRVTLEHQKIYRVSTGEGE